MPMEDAHELEIGTQLLALYEKEEVRLYLDSRLLAVLEGEEAAAAADSRIYQVQFVGGKKGISGTVAMLAAEHILLVKDETRMSGSRLSKALPHLPGMRGPPEDEWCNGYLEEYLDMHGSELPGVANVLLMCF